MILKNQTKLIRIQYLELPKLIEVKIILLFVFDIQLPTSSTKNPPTPSDCIIISAILKQSLLTGPPTKKQDWLE